MKEATRRLSVIPTPLISDAMAKGLSQKFKHQTMDSAIKPLSKKFKICGPAFTVRCYPGATYAMERAIAEAPEGTVIVCNGQRSDAGVMMGGLMSLSAQNRGILGAVIDGAVRDIDEVIAIGFPLFARWITPRAGTSDQLGDVQQAISCGSVIVRPDDIISADCNGVVVVPQEIVEQVAEAARRIEDWEEQVKQQLLTGKTLSQAGQYCEKPKIVDI